MTEKDKDMLERYIYEVIRRLPKEQREEIRMELNELIADMLEGEGETMGSVLTKLGNPAEFAKKYRDDKNYVIGPQYYDNYVWVLKIVMISVAASTALSMIIYGIIEAPSIIWSIDFFVDMIIDVIVNAIISGISGLGAVTLVFAILERYKIKVDLKEEKVWTADNLKEHASYDKKVWTPGQLLPVPDKRALISRGDSVAGIIFFIIFCGLLVFAPQVFGVYRFEDKELIGIIPLFNLDKWHIILPVLMLGFFAGFVDEIIRLATGCYCKLVMFSNIIATMIQMVFFIVVIKVLPFWNPDFMKDVSELYNRSFTSKRDIMSYWGTEVFSNIIVAIVVGISLLEMGVTIYKTVRYGLYSSYRSFD